MAVSEQPRASHGARERSGGGPGVRTGTALLVALFLAGLFLTSIVSPGGSPPSGGSRSGRAVTFAPTGDTAAPSTTSSTTLAPSTTLPPVTTTSSFATPSRPLGTAVRAPMTTTTAAPAAAPHDTAPVVTDTNCGGQPTVSVEGQSWSCTFDDEFNESSLDTSKWIVQQTATSNFHSGVECYENSPDNVSVTGGTLNLTVEQAAAPFVCPAIPPYPTDYTSGMVSTWHRFNQTFGLFEVRAKISGATQQGLQTSLWIYPQELTYGPWPASGEVDIAEMFSQYPTRAIPYVHYNNSSSDPMATNDNCIIGDPSQFHTYALLWTPWSMTFTYDGHTCLVNQWNPAYPQAHPQPFDQPFFVCLTQALGIGTNEFIPGVTPLPATTSVDWVRVWGKG